MTQTDKIKAYLLSQLSEAEMADFREEILQNPMLAARVRAIKLELIGKEVALQEHLQTQIQDWQQDLPPAAGGIAWWKWLLGLGLATVLIFLLSKNQKPEALPAAPPAETSKTEVAQPDTPTAPIAEIQKTPLSAWQPDPLAAAVFDVEVVKKRSDAVSKSSSKKEPTATEPQSLRRDFTGFFTRLGDGKNYFICSNSAVEQASGEAGSVVAHGLGGRKVPLDLVGTHLGITLLACHDVPNLPVTELAEVKNLLHQKALLFQNPRSSAGQSGKRFDALIRDEQTMVFLFSGHGLPSEGPVFNEKGQILGLITEFASGHFRNSGTQNRAALQASVIAEVVKTILENRKPAYAGLGFVENREQGGIAIGQVVADSPASVYEDELAGDRVEIINSQPLRNLLEVQAFFEKLKPREPITIVHTDKSGSEQHTIKTAELGAQALYDIAHAIFSDPNARKNIRLENRPEPTISRKRDDGVWEECRVGSIGAMGRPPASEGITPTQFAKNLMLGAAVGGMEIYADCDGKRTPIKMLLSQPIVFH